MSKGRPSGRLGLADPEHEVQLLLRIIDTISSGLDPADVVQGVATVIAETTATDVCFVWLLDDSGRRMRLRGATPPFHSLAGVLDLAVGEGVAGWVAAHGEPVVITENKRADPRYKYIPALRGEDYTSMASVPIVTRLGHLVGVLNVHTRRRREFGNDDVTLLRSVAGLVAGAIENARLYQRLTDREEALERFTERVVEMQEIERRRLAAEIHDGISQRIVSLFFHLSAAADLTSRDPGLASTQIATAQRLAGEALDEARFAVAGLRPPVLDDLGLAASLQSLAHTAPVDISVRVQAETQTLPEHVETAVYRIAQEALVNVARHSGADAAEVRLVADGDRLLLEVADDGRGFEPRSVGQEPGPGGYGLPGMRERAELLGGRLEVDSAPGRGTTLRLVVPLP